jgi:hypothetical protein
MRSLDNKRRSLYSVLEQSRFSHAGISLPTRKMKILELSFPKIATDEPEGTGRNPKGSGTCQLHEKLKKIC